MGEVLTGAKRSTKSFQFPNSISIDKFINWGKEFDTFLVLNSNEANQIQKDKYSGCNILVAIGQVKTLYQKKDFFISLHDFKSESEDWIFGYMTYDLKNQVENLQSSNHDRIKSEDFYFFQPRYVLEISEKEVIVNYLPEFNNEKDVKNLFDSLINFEFENQNSKSLVNIYSKISKDDYSTRFNQIKKHIHRGDIYEMNFCMEFYSEDAVIDPENIYLKLNELSPMPFSAFMHINDIYVMCASPERFLAKRGNKIISQPIKGTAKRGMTKEEDDKIKEELRNNPKEQSENVMIVDLVRNDLSHHAKKGSVQVEELFGIKTFKQIHQMVSTVTAEIKEDVPFTDVIKNAFPMGSMTGAPKIRAMELIEEFESTKRGIYSGSIGYIKPNGDFDFNVVIRSIIYNSKNKYLSFMAGSAITDGADAEKEYEECLLKAATMKRVLEDL